MLGTCNAGKRYSGEKWRMAMGGIFMMINVGTKYLLEEDIMKVRERKREVKRKVRMDE